MSLRESEKRSKVRRVLGGLRRMYGEVTAVPRAGRRGAGLDTLVEAMLAQNTNMINATRGYRMLLRRFPSWTAVMNAPLREVQREIAICGLARMRARLLQALLRTVKLRRGALSIDFLAEQTVAAGFDFLTGFFGIGPKTAAFTLLFAFGHAVLPVDNGVLRVVRRLRLVRAKARDLEAQRVLSPLIDSGNHYAAHVLMFRHAKERCRARNPKCVECELLTLCPHGRRVVRHCVVDVEVKGRAIRMARSISAGIGKYSETDDGQECLPHHSAVR